MFKYLVFDDKLIETLCTEVLSHLQITSPKVFYELVATAEIRDANKGRPTKFHPIVCQNYRNDDLLDIYSRK